MTTPSIVKSAFIYTNGDETVGIPGEGATIQADGDWLIDLEVLEPQDRRPELEAFRAKLAEAFAIIWDEPAKVVFDFEVAEEE